MADKEPEQPIKTKKELIADQDDRTDKAIGVVEAAYNEAKRKIRTPLANFQESVLKEVVTLPLIKLGQEIYQAIIEGGGKILDQAKMEEFEKRRKTAVDLGKSYIEKMAKEGGLNAEAVSRMISDQNKKASRFADLLILNKNKKYDDLIGAMLFSLGSQGESSSLLDAGTKAQETVLKYLKSDFDKPNSEVIQYIWTIFSLMDAKPRIDIAKAYLKGKPADKVEAFLQKGSAMGVFTSDEMKELNPTKKYSEQEVKDQQRNWQAQNDYKKQAAALGMVPYGTENVAGKSINLRNGIMLFVKFGAGATVLGNFVTGAWQGGEFKGIGAAIKRVTNPQSMAAIGLYAGIKVLESDKTIDQLLYGNKEQEEAAANFKKEKNGNPKWNEWNAFFNTKDFGGGKVFFNYIQNLKKIHDQSDISKLSNYITPGNFSDFLKRMSERKKDTKDGKSVDAKTVDNVDYGALKQSFDKINPAEIMTFAKIFDTLNLGGKNGKNEYDRFLKEKN